MPNGLFARASTQVKATNLGLSLNLSNCSKMNKMHLCLNEMAWKASESSYMLPMFSNVISFSKHRMFIRHQLSTESSTRLHKENLHSSPVLWYTRTVA